MRHDKIISDSAKVFELFRIGGDTGFGWEKERLARENPGRLRVFAQNARWAVENRERVEAMLESRAPEADLRRTVQEARKAEAEGREEQKEEWETVVLRLDPSQASIVKQALAGLRLKAEQLDLEQFSAKPAVALGQLVFKLCSEWLQIEEEYQISDFDAEMRPNLYWTLPETADFVQQALDHAAD